MIYLIFKIIIFIIVLLYSYLALVQEKKLYKLVILLFLSLFADIILTKLYFTNKQVSSAEVSLDGKAVKTGNNYDFGSEVMTQIGFESQQ